MKKSLLFLLLILGLNLLSAQKKYDQLWDAVEQYELDGKIKSALEVVDKILKKAKRAKKGDQIVKSFIYKSKFTLLVEENAQYSIVEALENEIQQAEFPYNAVLESVYAGMLQQYLIKNRYRITSRTAIDAKNTSTDFREWDATKLVSEIAGHYQKSLAKADELKKVPVKTFKSILTESKISEKFRPTLYDFLAHRALDFYKTDRWYVTRPKERFYLNQNTALKTTKEFSLENFYTKDSVFSIRNALKLFQKLEVFHLDQKDTTAYVDVFLERLKFVKDQAVLENKRTLYIRTIEEAENLFKDHEAASVLNYEIANLYYQESKQYNAKNKPDLQRNRIQALALCEKVIKKFPDSDGGILCKILKKQIEEKNLTIRAEGTVIPGKPFLTEVTFKSVDSLYLSIYEVAHYDNGYILNTSINAYQIHELTKSKKKIASLFYKLQPRKNFYEYTTEIDLPALPAGRYIIVASKHKKTKDKDDLYAYSFVNVSHLSALVTDQGSEILFKTLNRETGQAISDARATIIYSDSTQEFKKTDRFGEFSIKKRKEKTDHLKIIINRENDTLIENRFYLPRLYSSYNDDDDEHITKMNLFLDRSIYRPGQTMYFKGIVTEKKKGITKVVPNVYTYLVIYDTQDNELKEFRLKTNEYGSVSGSFKIPTDVLTGEFYIEMDEDLNEEGDDDPYWENPDDVEYAEISFSVEEYKRPRFEVNFDKISANYKIGDSIKAKGTAKAFLGASITDAQVSYTISRSRLIRSLHYFEESKPQLILNGKTKTDETGRFDIDFRAIPDSLQNKIDKPIFFYKIKADITDINGETRSAEQTIKIGYHNIKADLIIGSKLDTKKKQSLNVKITNLNDQPIHADVNIKIYKLIGNQRLLRRRPWPTPELSSISKERFLKLFPNEAYDSTDMKVHWPRGEIVFQKEINTINSNTITLDDIAKWKTGSYKIEMKAADVFKDIVTVIKQFDVYNSDNADDDLKLFSYEVENFDFKKDAKVSLKLKTAADSLHIHLNAYHQGKNIFKKAIHIVNGASDVDIPVAKNYKDKLNIVIHFVKYNSFYHENFDANFPVSTRELQIETLSFRDKLLPDQKENWSFKITNSDQKNAEAELLASMYDTSLDTFKEHKWNRDTGFSDYNYSRVPYTQTYSSFRVNNYRSLLRFTGNQIVRSFKNYNQINWFGFDFNDSAYSNSRYLKWLSDKKKQKYKPSLVEGNISGIISDQDGNPLPGVNVVIKGTTIGTQTDFNGYYSINAPPGSELVFSYLGQKTTNKTVKKSGVINILMEEDAAHLDEIVVTAYGVQKKAKLSAAVTTISAETIENVLQRQAAGIDINRGSGEPGAADTIILRGRSSFPQSSQTLIVIDGIPVSIEDLNNGLLFSSDDILDINTLKSEAAMALYGNRGANGVIIITTKKGLEEVEQVEARNNLKETAFFLPHLTTDENGLVSFNFSSPQALTKWKLMLLAHNKKAEIGRLEKFAVTQKDLSIVPNVPRFLREKDTVIITAKISNLTNQRQVGVSILQLFDAVTMEAVDQKVIDSETSKNFSIIPKGNTNISWRLIIPEGLQALRYKILAKSGKHSDGEASVLSVLSNRILVTESKPIWVKAKEKKEIILENLKNNSSNTLENHQFTLEYTSNPTWLAIQSLPYLMEFPHECAEQTFSRFYSNTLAAHIVQQSPEIREVFESWERQGELTSELEKNEALKSILIAETPWVRDAVDEKEQKARLASLFDVKKLKDQEYQIISKLERLQLSSGAFPWFSGGIESTFTTRHIVAGFGHLKKLKVKIASDYKANLLLKKAIAYLDRSFKEVYQKEIAKKTDSTDVELNRDKIHYLYARSFFTDSHPMSEGLKNIIGLYLKESEKDWFTKSLYNKGMIALYSHRLQKKALAKKIITSLKESSVNSDENGRYWKENVNGWYWYNAPVEVQALLIESFSEIENDTKTVEELKMWLLRNKQANSWKTTKATTEAVYALLLQGNDWLSVSDNTVITLSDKKIQTKKLKPTEKEAGTGYLKINWDKKEISPDMALVKVNNKSEVTGFGGVYWQYFEDLDKVKTSGNGPLKVAKKIFLKKRTDEGEKLISIKKGQQINVGDLVTIRLEITVDNDMEFIHLKDLRAAGFEPVDVLSEYKWQDGLGYYQSTKDVATHFFFDRVSKGVYIFEYDLRANNSGAFSTGTAIIQSMYAPEFSGHSKGSRIEIKASH